jgi:hypothetical protein
VKVVKYEKCEKDNVTLEGAGIDALKMTSTYYKGNADAYSIFPISSEG